MKEAYPLQWPAGYPRTNRPQRSNFNKRSLEVCKKEVLRQVNLLQARTPVISTNVPLRLDGMPYSGYEKKKIEDKGVAVYFIRNGQQSVLACDYWDSIEDNIWAIAISIDAMRSLDRWKVSDIINRAFQGLTELPMIAQAIDYWSILDMEPTKDKDKILCRYKELAKRYATDEAQLRDLNTARDLAIKNL